MRKLFLLSILSVVLLLASCTSKKPYTITWDLTTFEENDIQFDSLCLVNSKGELEQKTTELVGGKAILKGEVGEAEAATLIVFYSYGEERENNVVDFILEPGDLSIDNDCNACKGTALNDKICDFNKQMLETYDQNGDCSKVLREYFGKNKGDLTCPIILTGTITMTVCDSKTLDELWKQCTPEQQEISAMKDLRASLDKKLQSAAGEKFIDFECEYNGKIQRLSDYVGKGKYVLVDFWASWCGPCREEIPNIIAAYNKYHDKGLDVVGVATWDKPEDTMKAVLEEKIPYPQMLNAQDTGSKAYGIDGIPEIILFGPDGTIIERGLRGEQIEKVISENMK